ncbi:hypothetical protein Hanom_Chr12g01083041 [Helianthus anomalus]
MSPRVFLVSPLNPTSTEGLGMISDSGIFIFLRTSSWIMFTELPPSIRILRTKWLEIKRVITKPSW